jgi:hypothetical protein
VDAGAAEAADPDRPGLRGPVHVGHRGGERLGQGPADLGQQGLAGGGDPIYAETERLARLGLLAEERELTGRRRRSYRITAGGRAALAAWLAEPATEPPHPTRSSSGSRPAETGPASWPWPS